jgi:hypothetical protein
LSRQEKNDRQEKKRIFTSIVLSGVGSVQNKNSNMISV